MCGYVTTALQIICIKLKVNLDRLPPEPGHTRPSPGSNTPQDTNCTATCPLSRKLFKLDEPDMQDTAGEAEMNS